MAIIYPYSLNDFADRLDIGDVEWSIRRNDELSGSGDARIWQAELADPLWTGDVRLTASHHHEAKQVAAMIRKLHGAQHSFLLYDPLSKYPQSVDRRLYRNVILNPSFEDGQTHHVVGDNAGGSWGTATETSRFGRRSLRYIRAGQTGTATYFLNGSTGAANKPLHLAMVPGERVFARTWSRRFGGTSATAFMNIVFRNAAGASVETQSVSVSMTESWAETTFRYVAPAGTDYVTMALVVSNAGNASFVYFDDAELRRSLGARVASVAANRNAISVKDLPPNFEITGGDKLQIEWGSPSQNYFGEFSEDITANANGLTGNVEVFPHVPLGIVADDDIGLIKPAARGFIMPDSHSPGRARGNVIEGQGFRFMERRR